MIAILITAVIFTAGLLGMMGLGGGIVYVPLLSWWGLDFKTGAIPLSLLLTTATGMTAAYTYYREQLVHTGTALSAIVTVLVGAPVGAYAMTILPTGIIKVIFSIAAGYVAFRILRYSEPSTPKSRDTKPVMIGALILGFLVGFSSGLLGIGGGFILVPFLLVSGIPTKEAIATSAMVVSVSSMAAFISHFSNSNFPWTVGLILAAGAVVGSRLGGLWASRRAKPQTLRTIVGVVILVISLKVALEGVVLLVSS